MSLSTAGEWITLAHHVKAEADDGGRPFATPLAIIENHRILVSQRNQQLVAAQVTNTINNFNE